MKKININGKDYIKLSELRWEIKRIKDTLPTNRKFKAFSDKERNVAKLAIGEVIRAIYKEELEEGLAHAHTPDEIRAVYEAIYDMPGDFIVYRRAKNPKDIPDYFMAWDGGHPIIGVAEEAMIFSYESMAKEVAERLGDGWKVMDISEEAVAADKRLLNAIFDEPKYTKRDAENVKLLLAEFLEKEDADEALKDRLFDNVSRNIDRLTEEGVIEE